MYGWLWRRIPGPIGVKVALALAVVVAVVAILFLWVFPVIAPMLPFQQTTVGG